MSGIGTTTAEEVFSERVELQPRTSDPSGTEEGEGWIRSDVAPETDQIGTLRFDTGSGTVDLPIFDTAASPVADIETHLRVPVGGQQGFIPTTNDGAAVPKVGVWDSGTRYGAHNALELSPVPQSVIDTRFIGSGDNSLYAIDADTGSEQWSYATGGNIRSSTIGGADGWAFTARPGVVGNTEPLDASDF